jgi:hypothetical protein
MALLTPAKITALEAIQATLDAEANKIQAELNTLYDADPEHTVTTHSAWRPFWEVHQALKTAIVKIERVVVSNSDSYGEWKF